MKYWLLFILFLWPFTLAGAQNNTPDYLKILDSHTTPPGDVMTMIYITTFQDTVPVSEKHYTWFSNNETGQFLLLCTSPVLEQGFGYIKRKDRTWIYSPVVRAFFTADPYTFIEETAVRIEDFLPRGYRQHYKIQGETRTTVNNEPALKLELESISGAAPWDRMLVWLHEETLLLLKEEMFDIQSHLLKKIWYSGYREKDGWYQPSRILINDVLKGDVTSVITITKTTLSPIPDYVFTRSFIEFITR